MTLDYYPYVYDDDEVDLRSDLRDLIMTLTTDDDD